ncbi:MAG: hydrogenase formation protein HypD [Anaerolineae bacterium]|nr:hydrogenase formation protein HypD [Anaerolineae bacterium]
MKYVDEFRDPALARKLLGEIAEIAESSTRPLQFMEFCGGHTHAIFKFGLRQLLPESVHLRSGPGCPVCVTSATDIERSIAQAHIPGIILTTFGDMMRVPGSDSTTAHSLQEARASGADIRIVYSPLDALDIAQQHPDKSIIFVGVGFETTAPTIAATILQAEAQQVPNFYVHCLHKLTPPATRAILDAGEVKLDGIIGPGHVTTIIGADAWRFLPEQYGIPCAIAGFESLDILRAVAALLRMNASGCPDVENTYGRSVQTEGNRVAQQMMEQVFEIDKAEWRGFGTIPNSGLALRDTFAHRDAACTFPVDIEPATEPKGCRCGEVLRGVIDPADCPLFRRVCSPRNPIGPCMVSNEGACAAHYHYRADI